MDAESIVTIATVIVGGLFGTGGIVAYLKARSEIRNADKSSDIENLKETIESIQKANNELQEQYRKALIENDTRCEKLAQKLQFIEIEYVKQSQELASSVKRIADLEIDLRKAHSRIETLEEELKKKNVELMRLEQENIELRKRQTKLGLMNETTF